MAPPETRGRRPIGARSAQTRAPAWAAPLTLALAVAGLAVSAYLTVEHFTTAVTLACPEVGVVNCRKVTSSEQSTLVGVPVAVLGTLYFAAMVVLSLPAAWRSGSPPVRRGRLAMAGTGVLFVLYLIYAELFLINAICLWCTVVHLLAVALFAVIVAASFGAAPT